MTQAELLQNGIGRCLQFLGRAGWMISITLSAKTEHGSDYQVHIDTSISVVLNGKEYTSSSDIDDSLPYGACTFDKKMATILSATEPYRLRSISYDKAHMLHLYFSNGLEIHSVPASWAQGELWRVFRSWTADIHLIAYQNKIVEEPSELTQQELDARRQFWQKKIAQRKTDHNNSTDTTG